MRARDRQLCQRCGRRTADGTYNLQHRRPRAAGGSKLPHINQATNLIVLCGTSATDPNGCHHHVESHRAEARIFGWSVHLNARYYPEEVPLLGRDEHGDEQWYWLEGFDRIPIRDETTALMRLVSLGIREDAL